MERRKRKKKGSRRKKRAMYKTDSLLKKALGDSNLSKSRKRRGLAAVMRRFQSSEALDAERKVIDTEELSKEELIKTYAETGKKFGRFLANGKVRDLMEKRMKEIREELERMEDFGYESAVKIEEDGVKVEEESEPIKEEVEEMVEIELEVDLLDLDQPAKTSQAGASQDNDYVLNTKKVGIQFGLQNTRYNDLFYNFRVAYILICLF